MPFKAPLTHAELRAIRERQPWNSDVVSLLWEVKRLRSALLRWHQVSSDLKRPAGLMGDIYDELLANLAMEPCVCERDQATAQLMDSPPKPRKLASPR
ncbi:hypothetical protein QEP16_08490 [Achromobacter insolitus]|jgi:hypothetical protein|uniref:Uncharacterized protein n=1 Tax=Achromobacter insolitus TaxID=217204 RepID=A0A6S7F7B8_9BURK|nr:MULTISPECIES: hypothetical protein [Achromobacter]APX75666.1 hypothetical protein BUW96_12825 [Achromobacter insolitus]AVG40585.1 hypothetical protein MC81_14935 [Achromobacter insolitus]AXA74677.1 hypothetical protein CE205_11775 [Achromobacter insolitus]MDH3063342.1 hypothetical protein [Achromobacter insolitus]MDQ6211968.1 hypothetical protein [Achromobacter insolitus]